MWGKDLVRKIKFSVVEGENRFYGVVMKKRVQHGGKWDFGLIYSVSVTSKDNKIK